MKHNGNVCDKLSVKDVQFVVFVAKCDYELVAMCRHWLAYGYKDNMVKRDLTPGGYK